LNKGGLMGEILFSIRDGPVRLDSRENRKSKADLDFLYCCSRLGQR
jgi:hypothetical protein